ncbi:glutamate receptor 1-like [Eriocheir sinensis]|uniref:glutamate receptor 1-like n=1 Tax=Eriocheir sinensis TaxID=95602 RepID=UPI0021C8B843|nr:glutamate receptor 1-like [Eriocheir sinensis]
MTGYVGDVWELLKGDMNFTYSVVTPADGLFGALEDGEWTGLVGDLMAGRAHVVVAHLSLTYDRAQVVDYSSVLIKFSYRIFARPPAKSGYSWSSYTRPFSMGVWLGVALTIVLLATIFFSISQWHLRQEVLKTTAGEEKKVISLADPRKVSRYRLWKKDALMLVWAALTQQGWPDSPEANSLRILFWTIYMVGLVVVAAYSATLVSFLAVADNGLPFESLADLKKLGGYRLGILKGSVLEEYFKSQSFREYWNALIEPYPDTRSTNYKDLRSLAMWDSDFAYVGSYEVQRLDPVGACTFQSARQHLLFNPGALGWPRGSSYVEIFDYYIIRLRESGLLQKLARKWYPQPYDCNDEPVIPLGFQQVVTAFVALGVGATLSMLFLSGEKFLFHRSIDNNKSQVCIQQHVHEN